MTIVFSRGVMRPVSKAEKPKRGRTDVSLSALNDCCGMLVDGHLAPEVAQLFPQEAEYVRHTAAALLGHLIRAIRAIMVLLALLLARFGRIDRSIREVTSRLNESLPACHH